MDQIIFAKGNYLLHAGLCNAIEKKPRKRKI